MPHLDAAAISADPHGLDFLREVLGTSAAAVQPRAFRVEPLRRDLPPRDAKIPRALPNPSLLHALGDA